jgi:hypothetical protein
LVVTTYSKLKNFPYFMGIDWIQAVKNADNIYRKQEKQQKGKSYADSSTSHIRLDMAGMDCYNDHANWIIYHLQIIGARIS